MQLSDDERRTLLQIARDAIANELTRKPMRGYDITPALEMQAGVFVTLEEHGDLRGCIGQLRSTLPLHEAVADAARSAATRDPRFPTVKPEELADIELEVSVLSPFERVVDFSNVVPGRDGLMVQKGSYSGLLLPQVASDYGWGREEFLSQTCRKAGLPMDAWRDPACTVEKFTADVFSEHEVIK